MIVATSNLPELLDRALFRRFDLTIEYPMPTAAVARSLIRNRLATLKLDNIDWKRITAATKGLSHAEITLAAEHAAKNSILSRNTVLSTEALLKALRERKVGKSSTSQSEHDGT